MRWSLILEELQALGEHKISLDENLSDLTLDTLHGSMWGLNHRFMSLEECLENDHARVLQYSINRIKELVDSPDISFQRRKTERCGIGVGTYGWRYDERIIITAVEKGACLIDTAEGYGYGKVETELGRVLKKCGPVEVTTKIRRDHMSPNSIHNAVKRSNQKLGVIPHVQLHFPHDKYPYTIKNLADLRQKGLILSIGLGNCSVDMIESAQRFLSDYSGDVIRSVQVRFNLVDQRIKGTLLSYCQNRGILILAYSPLGQKFRDFCRPILQEMADKYDASPAQVALAWILGHRGVMPIPRTNNIKHLQENMEAVQLELSQEDMEELGQEYLEGD